MATYNLLIGNEVARTGPSLTQVYQATHDNGQYKPYMYRSFISFSYGGKNIEDFNLIATIEGDRLEKEAYASFEDLTSTYDTIQGQFYWNTYFHTNSITFNLATDGMTQRELDEFKFWFRAGKIKELILAEHPNRAIMARVANPPQLKLLPFETPVQVKFSTGIEGHDNYYSTSTTLYKGEIILEMVMDEPFWYARQNILGRQVASQGYYEDGWIDANGVFVSDIKNSKDALKIIYEDQIPLGSAVAIDVFLGGDIYASLSYMPYGKIVTTITDKEYESNISNSDLSAQEKSAYIKVANPKYIAGTNTPQYLYYIGACIAYTRNGSDELIGGRIAGVDLNGVDEGKEGLNLPAGEKAYLYYAGTAPSPVKLTFSLKPQFGEGGYIVSPFNKYSVDSGISTNPYNTITLKATKEHVFQFTIPSLYASYNQIVKIFSDDTIMNPNNAWLVVRESIRDTVRHPIIRKWANKILDKYHGAENKAGIIGDSGISQESLTAELINGMRAIFLIKNSSKNFSNTLPAIFSFNGKTGESIGHYVLRDPDAILLEASGGLCIDQIIAQTEVGNKFYTIEIEENVGDMVKSSYLILDERNVLNDYSQVQKWTENNPDYSYVITHDVRRGEGLKSLHFEFKNMYL